MLWAMSVLMASSGKPQFVVCLCIYSLCVFVSVFIEHKITCCPAYCVNNLPQVIKVSFLCIIAEAASTAVIALAVRNFYQKVSHGNTTACKWLDHEDINSDAGCEHLFGAMVR